MNTAASIDVKRVSTLPEREPTGVVPPPPNMPARPSPWSSWSRITTIMSRAAATKITRSAMPMIPIVYLPWSNLTIGRKLSASNEAPPTSRPSMCSIAMSSAAFPGLTDPPYWMTIACAAPGL